MLNSRRFWGCLLVLGCCLLGAGPGPSEPVGRFAFQSFAAEDGLRNQAVGALAQDRDGFIWVGTDNRVFRYDGERFEAFGEKEGLPSNFIQCLQVGPAGDLWVGTLLGLARWDRGRFRPVAPDQGLPAVAIDGLAADPEGAPGAAIWVATPLGPYRMEPEGRFAAVPGWPGGAVTALGRGRVGPGIWAAGWDGRHATVRRWDGHGWQSATGAPGFDRARIDALAVDFEGTVWARSLGELWEMPEGAPGFRRGALGVEPTQNRGTLHLDARGRLWVPAREALYCREHGRFTRFGMADGLPRPWPGVVLVDREGSLWLGGYGLHQRRGDGAWRSFSAADGPAVPSVWCFLHDRAGGMLVGTDVGVLRLKGHVSTLVPGTAGQQVRSMVLGPRDGGVYLATSSGILRMDPGTLRLAEVEAGAPRLKGGRVYRLLFDRHGDLWAATDGRGLFHGTRRAGHTWAFEPQDVPGGDAQEHFYDLVEDRQGRLWAAGDAGLALREGPAWRRFTTRDGLVRDQLAYLACTRAGELLVAYYEAKGLTRARYSGGRLTILGHLDEASGLASNEIYLVGEDEGGRLWVGTDNGVDRIDAGGRVMHFGHRDGLPTDDINAQAFLADPGGDVWIGTASGPARFASAVFSDALDPPRSVIFKVSQGPRALPAGTELATAFARDGLQIHYAAMSYIQGDQLEHQVRMVGLEPEWRSTRERVQRYPGLAPGRYVFEVRGRIGTGPWGPVARMAIRIRPLWWQSAWFWGLSGLALAGLAAALIILRIRRIGQRTRTLEDEVKRRTQDLKDAYSVLEVVVDDLAEKNMEMELRNRELAETRDQALVAAQAKTRFLSTMSHEIRTPINGVLGGAELLLASELDPRQRECIEVITRSGDSLLATLNDMLDFAKLEAGELELESIPFDLATLAFDVIELMRPRAMGKRLEFIVDLDPGLPPRLLGDPTRLRQTLGNLVSNAIKFTDLGQVLVRARLLESVADRVAFTLAVTDTGTGIPLEAQARLFQPFTQLDGSSARKYGGAGMGLALCRRFLDAMGGRITLESAEGQGSTFTLYLDLPVDPGQAPAAASGPGLEGLRVLVADSSPQGRHVAGKRLGEAGVQFELAETGPQALERARAAVAEGRPFDLAILDLQIPAGEAATLGNEIRFDTRLAGLGLIYVSPLGRPGEGAMMEGAGYDAYLVSPVRQPLLVKVLAMVVERRRGGGVGGIITRHTVAEAETAREPGRQAGEGLRTLLAEDNETNQKISTRMLVDLGATVVLAADGFQVLEALAAGPFDMIFMDCQMPGMDGFTATRRVREGEPGGSGRIPIIAMTANALEGDRELCLAAGMDDFLSKPFTRQGLQAMLGKWRPGGVPSGRPAPAEPAAAIGEDPFWDEGRFNQMKDLFGTEPGIFYEEILGPFEVQAHQQIQELRSSLAGDQPEAVRMLAHTLKGASRNLGFTALGMRAEALERLAKAGTLQEAPAALDEIIALVAKVATLLEPYRA